MTTLTPLERSGEKIMSTDPEQPGSTDNGTVSTFGFKGQSSGVTGTDVPLVMLSAFDYNKHKPQTLPNLPSHRFRYSLWHDLKSTQATGDQLKAPRVRNAPDVKEKTFHVARDDEGQLIHHSLSGKGRARHQYAAENWENALVGNFPYQDLSHSYQRENFQRILRRLIRVKILNLAHNDLTSLSSHSFPCCEELNLNHNYISSFKDLPKLPQISYLTLCMNDIPNLDGLDRLAKTPLHTLHLYGNGVTFIPGYRQRVFHVLPNLKVLDNIPKLESDDEVLGEATRSCVIS